MEFNNGVGQDSYTFTLFPTSGVSENDFIGNKRKLIISMGETDEFSHTILVNIKLRPIFTEYSASVEHPRRKEVSVNLVKKLCDGLAMTMGEFFPQRCLMIWSRRYSRTPVFSDAVFSPGSNSEMPGHLL